MQLVIRLLVSFQLIAWAAYMGIAYLGPDENIPGQSLQGFLFLCLTAALVCFVPALRLARRFTLQPFALMLAIAPIFAVAGVAILKFTQQQP